MMTEQELMIAKLRYVLYEAIVELEYVRCVENYGSGMFASAKGREIVKRGMKLLGVEDLTQEHLGQ